MRITNKKIKSMNIHHDLEGTKLIAVNQATKHNCNYNVIILNPNSKGEFDANEGSTYEMVADSYFDKPRLNAKLLHKTDDLIAAQQKQSA